MSMSKLCLIILLCSLIVTGCSAIQDTTIKETVSGNTTVSYDWFSSNMPTVHIKKKADTDFDIPVVFGEPMSQELIDFLSDYYRDEQQLEMDLKSSLAGSKSFYEYKDNRELAEEAQSNYVYTTNTKLLFGGQGNINDPASYIVVTVANLTEQDLLSVDCPIIGITLVKDKTLAFIDDDLYLDINNTTNDMKTIKTYDNDGNPVLTSIIGDEDCTIVDTSTESMTKLSCNDYTMYKKVYNID